MRILTKVSNFQVGSGGQACCNVSRVSTLDKQLDIHRLIPQHRSAMWVWHHSPFHMFNRFDIYYRWVSTSINQQSSSSKVIDSLCRSLFPGRHHQRPIVFCRFLDDAVRLIHIGYLASSAKVPRTAFSIWLVQFHHQVWQTSAISTTTFIEGVMGFLDNRCHLQLLLRSKTLTNWNLHQPFTQSVDLYCRIMRQKQLIYKEGMQLTSAQLWANQCPRCFGPRHGETKVSADKPNVIIAMDGNFQHRHQTYASKDLPKEEEYPSSFLLPSKIQIHASNFHLTDQQAKGVKVSVFLDWHNQTIYFINWYLLTNIECMLRLSHSRKWRPKLIVLGSVWRYRRLCMCLSTRCPSQVCQSL